MWTSTRGHLTPHLSSHANNVNQRLKAWQPILTPKTVLPTFLIVGIIFAPIGGLLLWASDTVKEISIDYTHCDQAGETFVQVPTDDYSIKFPGVTDYGAPPEYRSIPWVASGNNVTWDSTKCTVKFNVPDDMKKPVFVYYRLTNFYQNHRRYVKSVDQQQLYGEARTISELKSGNCSPLDVVTENGTEYPIYPCGLIANSLFNDTIGLFLNPFDSTTNGNKTYILTDTDISWKSDRKKYQKTQYTDLSQIRPPPNWRNFPNGYSEQYPPIDPSQDEHFQVWMRLAGLPDFRKLYSKNENDDLTAGTYTIDIEMNYNVTAYAGTKHLVISTVSFMGGRNSFMGIAYVVVGSICVVLGLLFTARHLYKPRRLGDQAYLSWNQTAAANAAMTTAASTATATGASARY
ncbi:hypothetical protein BGZ80_008282 [Entomortierella chlamydospora]|uniref:Lem3 cdc50 family protein n=1 Tax=Entomortierella chlamydospora TaxID=101097 RepID=A0A9P6T1P6_9FUNG|nr:hypothetical protein BGZ80_008282 [Entomortierella chlamydospora]